MVHLADGGGIIWLIAIGWGILSVATRRMREAAKKAAREPDARIGAHPDPTDQAAIARRARLRAERARLERAAKAGAGGRGTALKDLQREIERVMGVHAEEEHGPIGRHATVALQPAEEVEERESLEVERTTTSRGDTSVRAERAVVDQDLEAEGVIQQRLAVAESHTRPLSRADHQRFDATIRAQPAGAGRTVVPAVALRRAFIWSEVLGKPVSLRDG